MQHILLQKEKALIQAKENQTLDVKDFEKTRFLKKYEMKMIQERQQLEIMHNLEVQRIKVQSEGRFNI